MTTLREAAQMALDALEQITGKAEAMSYYCSFAVEIESLRAALANEFNPDWDAMAVMVEVQQRMAKRIEELESALAQPEQEPVAYKITSKLGEYCGFKSSTVKKGDLVYTAPPQREWQGLTDEEIKDTLEAAGMDTWFSYRHAARAIEAKLKEKNT